MLLKIKCTIKINMFLLLFKFKIKLHDTCIGSADLHNSSYYILSAYNICQLTLYQIHVMFHKGGITDEETEGSKAIIIHFIRFLTDFFTWTIIKVFIEFVTILSLFYVAS